jgi:hypothetical protein
MMESLTTKTKKFYRFVNNLEISCTAKNLKDSGKENKDLWYLLKMELSIKESGCKELAPDKVLVFRHGLTVQCMKAGGQIIKLTVKVV